MINDIKEMIKDLNDHKRQREDLLSYFIECRLNKSIQVYYDQLASNVDHLALTQDLDKVVVKLSKENFK